MTADEPTCHAEASIDLPLDPQAAWDAVVDWDAQSEWMVLTRVWATENQGRGLGGGVAARTSVGPLGFTDDMVITHWDPPRECTVKHLGTIVRGTGTFAVTPASGGSTFTWSEDVILPLGRLGRIGWAVVRPGFELIMRTALKRLENKVTR
ncbi:polyketide cyclase/dehydrase/lipid transport protein [Kribbella orskensis]|uniref:Polyketide cyclase/dehydrase/lipid transport protein n=1 Tax=Kribbella orskensis TaxID=2512216 RepID=A0ABY2BBU2_9ACTN|nr:MULTISPECIES: SRPBCC family protein [Kribbella]TCN34816.1 polyketide cyclase/dehydrase/lipid transport protein [Kribbella sp. VKM Ac-2500]TCO15521.1 polyketide cyclase/dehydrase/lipid transport protein [Kribbella orskensis]